MDNIVRTQVHKSELRWGDTVEIDGQLLTVGKFDVKYDSFMGYSLWGDASRKTVTRVQFAVPTNKGIVLR